MATPKADKIATSPNVLKYLGVKTFGPGDTIGRKIVIYSNPGLGKTVLAARLGKRNLIITDEDGYVSLYNHPELNDTWQGLNFESWSIVEQILPAIESGEFTFKDTGEPFDNIIFDTMTGMIGLEIRRIVKEGVTTQEGKVSAEAAGRPDYLISEQRLIPIMSEIAKLKRCSATILCHLRSGDKLTPFDPTRPDAHAAAFRVINKYTSVIAHLTINKDGRRQLQVNPTSNGVSVKSRYRFPETFMTDDEFVAHVAKWKGVN